jgi:Holliday junction resolvase-like predicted endonuclease
VTSYDSGRRAEQTAEEYLVRQGYEILQRNWRTKHCEIDIVAQKDGAVWFVEVKYRGSDGQGTGIDYITASKLRQMRYAAELWLQHHDWADDCGLAAIELSGPTFEVTNFIEDIQ